MSRFRVVLFVLIACAAVATAGLGPFIDPGGGQVALGPFIDPDGGQVATT